MNHVHALMIALATSDNPAGTESLANGGLGCGCPAGSALRATEARYGIRLAELSKLLVAMCRRMRRVQLSKQSLSDNRRSLSMLVPSETPSTRAFDSRDRFLIAIAIAGTIVILGKDISVGGLRDGDSAVHAMDGVLILDWVRAGPRAWLSPMEFAVQQYAHYPALAIGRHYPPGFAMVEAVFFAVFGVSAFTARLCVLCFGCAAAAGMYLLAKRIRDRVTGFIAAMFLITMPAVVHWGRQEMLELPTLAVMIGTAVACLRYLERPTARRLLVLLAAAVAGLLFRQTALCLLGAVTLVVTWSALRRRAPRAHAAILSTCALAALVVVVTMLDAHGAKLLRGDSTYAAFSMLDHATFYARLIPSEAGVWIAPPAIVGIVLLFRRSPAAACLLAAWFGLSYVMLSVADYKNPRLLFVALAPVAIAAAVTAAWVIERLARPRWRSCAVGVAALALGGMAVAEPVEHRPDYGSVVLAHRDRIEGSVVLFSGLRDGDFVFAVRQHLPWRRSIVVRTSKLLYTCSGRPDLDFESLTQNAGELAGKLSTYGFETVFLERENKIKVPEEDLLREYLAASAAYERTAAHRLDADREPSYRDVVIDVYQSTAPLGRTAEFYNLPLPRANRTIRVPLSNLSG